MDYVYSEIHREMSQAGDITSLYKVTEDLLLKLSVDHCSFWGVDKERENIFFVADLTGEVGIAPTGIRVLNFGEGILGKYAEKNNGNIRYLLGKDKILESGIIAKDFVKTNDINSIMILPKLEAPYYKSIFFMASRGDIKSDIDLNNMLFFLIDVFLDQYTKLRNRIFRRLLIKLSKASLVKSAEHLINEISETINLYFRADSFSVWAITRDNQLENIFYLTKKSDRNQLYSSGEGATGYCYKKSVKFLSHRMNDLPKSNIPWSGKHSEHDGTPNENDHCIYVPIVSAQDQSGKRKKFGVLRFISFKDSPSFWPLDLPSAQTIAEIIGLRFSNDLLVERLTNENNRLFNLFKLSSDISKLGNQLRVDKTAFDSLVDNFNLKNIAYVTLDRPLSPDKIKILFNNDFNNQVLFSIIKRSLKSRLRSDNILTRLDKDVIFDGEVVVLNLGRKAQGDLSSIGMFILEFTGNIHEKDLPSLKLFSAVLEIAWENLEMFKERTEILQKWERVEAATRDLLVTGDFAHEVKQISINILGELQSAEKRKKNPDFAALKELISGLEDDARSILMKSQIKYSPIDCYLNEVIKETLKSYGIKGSNNSIGNCEVKVIYDNLLWGNKSPNYIVNVDSTALVGVLRNLINNSVEQYAKQEKTGPIRLQTYIEKTDRQIWAVVSVSDFAGGVSPEMEDRIWEPFETDKETGSGIGLWSCQTLVFEKMSGEIDEIGEKGQANFIIRLPATYVN